jgi:predicted deacetylase
MRITIRLDDITPDMDFAKFNRFREILDKKGICPLIGVVPDNRDPKLHIEDDRPDFWELVKELQQKGWKVAMHGYRHLYTTADPGLFPIGNKSEFAGLPLNEQNDMIRSGKEILEEKGIITDIFMAPSHSFDRNTLIALKNNGFSRMTDGFGIRPYRKEEIVFYPISVSRKRSLKDKRDGLVTFVYHANSMTDRDFEKLEQLLDTAEVVSYSENATIAVEDRTMAKDISQYLTAKAKYTAVRLRKLKG